MKPRKTAEAIQQEAAKKIHEAEIENRIFAMLPDTLERFDVSVYYISREVWVTVKAKTYPFDSPRITSAELVALGDIFQPEPMGRYKGWSLSYKPVAVFEAESEAKKEKIVDEQSIAPFTFEIEPASFSQSATLSWYAVMDGQRVRVKVEFPLHSVREWLGRSSVHYAQYMGGQRVESSVFTVNRDSVYTLFQDDEPIAQLGGVTNWAAGSEEYPGQKTVYWTPLSEKPVRLEAITSVLAAHEAKQLQTK
jgi:hypothetical protein